MHRNFLCGFVCKEELTRLSEFDLLFFIITIWNAKHKALFIYSSSSPVEVSVRVVCRGQTGLWGLRPYYEDAWPIGLRLYLLATLLN
ncbi:hypothetical protein CEXT_441711 [Caerostris extrusa]|uniref:Uncharacterized protein n=1 Tax=Caerostris extrusa TaxID=172846 RepID=A0AAV4U4R1_CAEEX|nr:hypothetical protein CEXT_441711 [Caerostris extrusa]